jgi:hypothetical protein
LFAQQVNDLILVKGAKAEKEVLYREAHLLSVTASQNGKPPLKIISPAMRKVFGQFGNKYSFQRRGGVFPK